MSDRISKCCGWGVHLGGIPSADPTAQVTEFYACDQCMKACDVETIEQRDNRMRVEGATWALLTNNHANYTDQEAIGEAARIVREMEEAKR